MKRCRVCGLDKPLSEFVKSSRMKDGYRNECRMCRSAINAEWRAKNDTPKRQDAARVRARAWAKNNPDKRRSYAMAREAAKRGAPRVEKVFRQVIYERDGYVCWICDEPTEPKAEDSGRQPSLDHVVALMDGGEHTVENLRCAHLRCNISRGVRRRWERKRLGLPGMPLPDPKARMAPLKVKPPPKDPNRRKPGAIHCRNNHLLDEANTMHVDGRRRCRICERERQKRTRPALYAKQRLDPEFVAKHNRRSAEWTAKNPERRREIWQASRERQRIRAAQSTNQ